MSHGLSVALQESQGLNSDAYVGSSEIRSHMIVRALRLHTFGRHGVVAHQQEGAGRDVVVETAGEECRRFHIDGHSARTAQIGFELFVVLPNAAVGGVDRAGPIVQRSIAERRRDGALQHEGRQSRHLGGKIVVGRTLTANTGERQHIVAQLGLVGNATRLAQEQDRTGIDARKQVHDQRSIGRAHTEIDHRDSVGGGGAHIRVETYGLHVHLLAEHIDVIVEVGQQYQITELTEFQFSVSPQPVAADLLFTRHHTISN